MVTVQRAIEAQGIPTTLITLDVEQSNLMRPPRAIHPMQFEFGHSLGKPHDKHTQTKVLMAALEQLTIKQEPGQIHEIHFPSYNK
ncbi:hypothetical protein HUR95_07560 [Caldalkalibacillus thermarum TA2.A1]|uniref:Uncharacterized protein n=1 Tax=Caldalkalibacillus thermarum (strain TA2.A1) TaxID=986075 RepID=A0A8X8I6Q4_CALTT|nr:hypothetical protein [Caldalkalibacillus thermarum]QZT35070.1 hypothetical protein HUR95_07560 [Caldalkalibacillus thermarum TA2.A1]